MNASSEIKVISNFENEQWINFISNNPNATIFHHPKWLAVLQKQYKYKTFIICLFYKKEIVSGIPFCEIKTLSGKKKWISLPFTDYCPALYEKKEDLILLLNYIKKTNSPDTIEIRDNINALNYSPIITHFVHTLDLNKPYDEVKSSYHKSQINRNIKKAEKNQLIVEKRYNRKALEIFYNLHLITRKKQGVPIQPKTFFSHIFNEIITNNQGFIVVIRKEEKPIAAAIFFHFNHELIYKFGASDPRYLFLRPNHILFDFAIKQAYKIKCTSFNFGKTDLDHLSLRNFKSYWGAIESELFFSYYPHYKSGKLVPIVNKNFISPIIKNTPKFVCRLIGELFYKFMG